MKVSVNWLKELVDIELSTDELAHQLTMAGLEVEEITPVAASFERIVVAEVTSTAPHPNADKLRVCEVNTGAGGILQIVCGAPNVVAGMKVPCALVGANLPGMEIRQAKLRGVESNGMLCSARELGLSDEHAGLLQLADDAPIGMDIRQYLELDDVYLTLKMTPNRGDCLSMTGIARDLAAVTGCELRIPTTAPVANTCSQSRPVSIAEPKACGVYLGRKITNINANAATPDWMKRRLERAGFRSISPLVDITNYLTLERGRPMHAFDDDKLSGDIGVRFAGPGEQITLLNDQRVDLQPDMLLITDSNRPVAMGGVMGGLDTMCTASTRNVFFEAAYFDPGVIQGKTRVLGINSDAAYRFERGVDPAGARDGIEYATRLTLDICGTPDTQVGPIEQACGVLPPRPPVRVRPARVEQLIGMQIPVEEMVAMLQRLQCTVTNEPGVLIVTPPSFRFDLSIEEDFVEEIARVQGYDRVPSTPPRSLVPMSPIPEGVRSRHSIRHTLADLGYQEVINYSFTPDAWEADFAANSAPLRLANPIASHLSVMRSNLVGGLLASLQHNLNHGETRVKIFEIGRCFLADQANTAAQPERVGGLVYGTRFPEQWGEGGQKGANADFYSVKGEIEVLMQALDIRFEKLSHAALHPGRAAAIVLDGISVGMIGELHPRWQQKYDLPMAPVLFEIDIEAITRLPLLTYRPISRMQALRRDIALLVPENTEIQALLDIINDRRMPSVIEFAPFDIYRGQNLESGKKSVALRVVMQDTARTLTDSEADSKVSEIVEVLYQKFGATLRK